MPKPPAKLSPKHHLIAYCMLAGATRDEIATRLDMEPTYISAITNSPMFKALLDTLRAEMRNRTIGSVVDQIVAEGPDSVRVLVAMRDGAESEQVRVTAARDLLDRNPETAKVSREDRRTETRIIIDSRDMARITGVLREDDDAVDATLAEPAALAPPAPPLGIQTLDEALAELAAEQEDA